MTTQKMSYYCMPRIALYGHNKKGTFQLYRVFETAIFGHKIGSGPGYVSLTQKSRKRYVPLSWRRLFLALEVAFHSQHWGGSSNPGKSVQRWRLSDTFPKASSKFSLSKLAARHKDWYCQKAAALFSSCGSHILVWLSQYCQKVGYYLARVPDIGSFGRWETKLSPTRWILVEVVPDKADPCQSCPRQGGSLSKLSPTRRIPVNVAPDKMNHCQNWPT